MSVILRLRLSMSVALLTYTRTRQQQYQGMNGIECERTAPPSHPSRSRRRDSIAKQNDHASGPREDGAEEIQRILSRSLARVYALSVSAVLTSV